MISPKTENAIIKFITKSATLPDLELLHEWIKTPSNQVEFKEYVKIHYAINFNFNESDANEIIGILLKKMRNDKSKSFQVRLRQTFKYAAIFIVFLGIGLLYQQGYFTKEPTFIIPEDSITLQLENGNIQIIAVDGSAKVVGSDGSVVGSQNGNQLVYDNEIEKEVLEYNTLTVPYGKRFKLKLSDGTNVHLNAGTSLKYPVKFLEGEKRQVFLSGEAYFDVAENKENPFIVNADDLNIQVLGTEFNVSTYPEDLNTDVVLVEGSVSLYAGKENDFGSYTILEPGFAGTFNKSEASISTKPVITSIYTSWIYGELVFRDITFSNILKKMERHYNVKITNTNLNLTDEKFNASFGDEPIEKILKYFESTYGAEFSVEENKVILN